MKNDYTSLELSKRLHEAGFRGESDAYYGEYKIEETKEIGKIELRIRHLMLHNEDFSEICSAYTAQSLFEVLPREIEDYSGYYRLQIRKHENGMAYIDYLGGIDLDYKERETLAEALGEMILELINRGIIKTDK